MRNLTNGTATVTALVVMGLTICADAALARVVLGRKGPRYHAAPSSHELVLEGGLAAPAGDQDDDYFSTSFGFSAETGYQLGVRWRQYMGGSLAVSPVFQYTNMGDDSGVTDLGLQTNLGYRIATSSSRYGLDLQGFVGPAGVPVRAYVTGGIGLVNNRYRDELQYNGVFEASVNSAAYSVGVGIKARNLEVAAEYTYNRFDTGKFSFDGTERSYNWDLLVVRLGIGFGR